MFIFCRKVKCLKSSFYNNDGNKNKFVCMLYNLGLLFWYMY